MTHAAIQRNMDFNPSEYHHNATRLVKERPELAANAMTQLARHMNASEAQVARSQRLTSSIIGGLTALGGMLGIGFWDGSNQTRAQAMVDDWENGGAADVGATLDQYPTPWSHPEGVKDPTTFLGFIPKMLASTAAFALAAAGVSAATKKYLVDENTGEVLRDEHGDPVVDENYQNVFTKIFLNLAFLNLGYWVTSFGFRKGMVRAQKKMNAIETGGAAQAA